MVRTTTTAIRAVLEESLAERDEVVLVGESVGRGGGIGGCTAGLLERFGKDRVIDVPVADRAAVAFAVGLALGGKVPVVELSATGRLPAVLEALSEAVSVAAADEFRVPMVVRVPYGTEAGDRVDRPLGDLIAAVPGLTVASGSDPGTVAGLLRAALDAGGPVVLLEPRVLYSERGETEIEPPSLGAARVVREGDQVTLAAWGTGVHVAVHAAEDLAEEGVSAGVIDLSSLAPLDAATLGAHVQRTGRLVVVHPDDAGLAERILRVSLHEAFLYLESPPSSAPQTAQAVAKAARASVSY